MVNILFVCHGNICRSTMAEFAMKQLVREAGLVDKILVESKALHRDEIGSDTHRGTREVLRTHNIPFSKRRATLMTAADYSAFDLIIGMDTENMNDLDRLTGGDPDGKVRRLLSYIGEERDVADPWYTGNFDITYRDVDAGCRALPQELTKNK